MLIVSNSSCCMYYGRPATVCLTTEYSVCIPGVVVEGQCNVFFGAKIMYGQSDVCFTLFFFGSLLISR